MTGEWPATGANASAAILIIRVNVVPMFLPICPRRTFTLLDVARVAANSDTNFPLASTPEAKPFASRRCQRLWLHVRGHRDASDGFGGYEDAAIIKIGEAFIMKKPIGFRADLDTDVSSRFSRSGWHCDATAHNMLDLFQKVSSSNLQKLGSLFGVRKSPRKVTPFFDSLLKPNSLRTLGVKNEGQKMDPKMGPDFHSKEEF
jgi:hypothetical protein